MKAKHLTINNNMQEMFMLDGSTINVPVRLDVTAEVIVDGDDMTKLHEMLDEMKEEPSLEVETDINGYMLKNCRVTGYRITDNNGQLEASVDIVAENFHDIFKNIEFKDGVHKVLYKHYSQITDNEDGFKNMTHSEFMDKVMVEEL